MPSNLDSGKLLGELDHWPARVWSVAFDPTGRTLATGCSDNTVKLWEVASGRLLRTLKGHTNIVQAVAFSADGWLLASQSYDGTLRLWSCDTWEASLLKQQQQRQQRTLRFWSCETWETVAVIVIPELTQDSLGLAFHHILPLLATVGSRPSTPGRERSWLIHFWELNLDVLLVTKDRDSSSIINELVDTVSKDGNLPLNISPMHGSSIPEPHEKILLEIAKWLSINGEAIYSTRTWKQFGEGPSYDAQLAGATPHDTACKAATATDFRFTMRGDALYAIALTWPGEEAIIKSLAASQGKVKSVALLGHGGALKFTQDGMGLRIKLPTEKPGEYAFVFKIVGLKRS